MFRCRLAPLYSAEGQISKLHACTHSSIHTPRVPLCRSLLSPLQEIEDLNVMHKFDRRLERLAMVMPLTDQFDPGVTHFAHEHLQVGVRLSLSSSSVLCQVGVRALAVGLL